MEKTCNKCKVTKPISEYYKHKGHRDGVADQCKECANAASIARHHRLQADPEYRKRKSANSKRWNVENSEHREQYLHDYYRKKRMECIEHYGGKCACCGEDRFEFLAFDHIEGNGNKHRKANNIKSLHRWLRRNGMPEGFRVLCHNCNSAIGFYGFCPHNQPVIESINIDRLENIIGE